MKISVVIPALNESAYIDAAIESVHAQTPPLDVIVVDGGSTDDTVRRASARARVLTASPGRGRQMNRGAARATGDVLLFLHADTVLPPGAFDAVRRACRDVDTAGGCFRLAFDVAHPLLRLYAFTTRLPWHRIAFGDRAHFVRRSLFEAAGGFSEEPLFEDLDLVRRVLRRGRWRYLPLAVTTAARRVHTFGYLGQQARNTLLWTLFWLGVPPERLKPHYPYPTSILSSENRTPNP